MRHIYTFIIVVVVLILVAVLSYWLLSRQEAPESITYGVSFNTLYARELGLDWEEVYRAVLDDLGVRHLRLAAHWPMIEPEEDVYNFTEMDVQMNLAQERGADVVFAVGRRLPRWPECHVPEWAQEKSWEIQKEEIRAYMKEVIDRYKDYDNILYWQVENEPFLGVFAAEHCGELDKEFLDEEIALVRSLDPSRPVLITDSGNLGLWASPYKRGDLFGTSVYVYLWNPQIGPFKSRLPASFYRAKQGLMELLFGEKETLLIELSAEPWLIAPVVETDLETQLNRMNIEKFEEIISFARDTRLEKQFLWGAEWWYWLRERGHSDMWDRARTLYSEGK